jgi:hypothetical protein
MGNQSTKHTNLGLADGESVCTSFRCTRGQRRKLTAMANAAKMDKSSYIRRQLGLDKPPAEAVTATVPPAEATAKAE